MRGPSSLAALLLQLPRGASTVFKGLHKSVQALHDSLAELDSHFAYPGVQRRHHHGWCQAGPDPFEGGSPSAAPAIGVLVFGMR